MIDYPMFELFGNILFLLGLGFAIVGSYFDLKTGEIPDKFTVGLVAVALGIRLVVGLVYGSEFGLLHGLEFFFDGLVEALILFGIGAFLFYTGGWGGGDTKLIAGIGACIGASLSDPSGLYGIRVMMLLLISIAVTAIPYAILYSLILAFRNPECFSDGWKQIKDNSILVSLSFVFSLSGLFFTGLNPYAVIVFLLPSIILPFVFFVRSVERIALRTSVKVSKLNEGDMVAEDLVVDGKKIVSRRNMDGLSAEDITTIKKLAKDKKIPADIVIRRGIKFAPVFPLALILYLFIGNLISLLV